MGFDFIKKLPTPEEIRNQYPIDAEIQAVKDARDKELRDVFTGKSDKFLAIMVLVQQIMKMLFWTILPDYAMFRRK